VYDNEEYKAHTLQKYGKFEPPTAKSPVKMETMMDMDFSKPYENTSESFMVTNSNFGNIAENAKEKMSTMKTKLSSNQNTPITAMHRLSKTSRRGTSLVISKSEILFNDLEKLMEATMGKLNEAKHDVGPEDSSITYNRVKKISRLYELGLNFSTVALTFSLIVTICQTKKFMSSVIYRLTSSNSV
jgi:hypothetical protein